MRSTLKANQFLSEDTALGENGDDDDLGETGSDEEDMDVKLLDNVLTFLQLSAEGHYLNLQNYLR